MGKYEYKVLPTPRRAKRAKGVKGEPARFAHALTEMMNVEAAQGWEYLKSETLPMEAKSGMFKGVTETFQCVLVFRRSLEVEDEDSIVSMTLTEAQNGGRVEPIVEAPEPARPEPVKAKTVEQVEDLREPVEAEVNFDEDNIDPLKTLVEGHRNQQKATD